MAVHADDRARILAITLGLAGTALLLLAGCVGLGPTTVTRDRFDYVTNISDSWKRQTLLNLLKVRYHDAPVFMDVSSVISSYSLEGEVSLGGQFTTSRAGADSGTVGVTGRYADQPTITYQPLSGEKFAKSMMTPIPVTGILFLIQSGQPADLVLRLCVNTINGLENAYGSSSSARAGDPAFRELMTAMQESQAEGGMGFRVKAVAEAQAIVMFMRPSTAEAAEHGRRVGELLDLDTREREFTVVYGSSPASDREIAMLTRSVLQVMVDLASYIEVPPADIAEGRVASPARSPEQLRLFPPMITVRHGAEPPEDAHVAVPYRKQWFWIDDRDQPSKEMLNFLMFMVSLTESGPSQGAPVVTVPAR